MMLPININQIRKSNWSNCELIMKKSKKHCATIDEYIASFPKEIQKILESIRQTIRSTASNAKETISYQMPTFRLKGILVHFAAHMRGAHAYNEVNTHAC
jgi:uncharacterized protein YdhG (YjbR/CyaY superfamily)